MVSSWRALRRRILTPNISETKLSVRGFHQKSAAATELLETVGETFLTGYAHAVEARTVGDTEDLLEQIPTRFRGFAYEGAAMGLAVLDALPLGGGGRLRTLLAGRGDAHVYMAYVGAGWAMARVPRFRWSKIHAPDPLLRWLALDGYGFHQAYFHTAKYVRDRYQEERFPWPAGGSPYANRAIDQGIGRAIWFVAGTDPDRAADLIDRFPESRLPDLYGGVGLAATYAGGSDEGELRRLAVRAGAHRPALAQGSAFAAEARVRAGLVVPQTRLATQVFWGESPEFAAQVCHRARPGGTDRGDVPAYEVWRRRIADEFAALRGVR